MSSIAIIQQLVDKGMITKTAAEELQGLRHDLIKTVLEQETIELFRLDPAMNKEASFRDVLKDRLLPVLGLAGLIAVGTAAAKTGVNALSDFQTKRELGKSYKGVFEEYPELEKDRENASKFFTMMAKYAPSIATNPIVAGTWMKQMMNMNVVDPRSIKELIEAQSSYEDVRAMKSPLVSWTQELPRTQSLFEAAMGNSKSGTGLFGSDES